MHLATLLPLVETYSRTATTVLAAIEKLAPMAPLDPYAGPTASFWNFTTWRSCMELSSAAFCLFCTVGLAGYFTYAHHQIRLNAPKGLRKRSLWTVDQINACLITFAMAVMFLILHYCGSSLFKG